MLVTVNAEMLRCRIVIQAPAMLVRQLNTNKRFLTSSYKSMVSRLCTFIPYRIANDVLNELSGREAMGSPVPLNTFVKDYIEEGQAVKKAKQELALSILNVNGFDSALTYTLGEFPNEWKNQGSMMITITGNDPLPSLIDDWDEASPGLQPPDEYEEEEKEKKGEGEGEDESGKEAETKELYKKAQKLYSQPDMKEFLPVKKRRTKRTQVSSDEIEWVCNGYVTWYNNLGQDTCCKIIRTWVIEKDSDDVVYIMVDAVYVNEQAENHVKGIKPEMKKKKNKISHWNIAVEVDGLRYALTALTRIEVYQQLFAFLLENKLMGRYLTFMIDGENCIFDDINTYFSSWEMKTIFLDWYHIEEKVIQKLSSAIKHKMVVDPRTKSLAKKDQKNTALSNLYARKLLAILWVGNVEEAILYCQNIDPEIIKNQGALDELISYFERKGRYMTCYAIRRRAGLRNSSNGSENVNQVTVAKRQKHNYESWREEGSSSVSNMSALYANGEDKLWFQTGKATFNLRYKKESITKKAEA